MTLQLLAVGEGPDDIGRAAERGSPEEHGVVTILVERALPDDAVVEWRRMRTKDRRLKLRGNRPRPPGRLDVMAAKVYRALVLARDRRLDGVVFHSDALTETTLEELRAGRAAAQSSGIGVRCALAVPHPETEAWLIADVETLEQVLGVPVQGQLRSRCVGVERRSRAKELWEKVVEGAGEHGASQRTRARARSAVAAKVRPEVLSDRCPKGFVPFWEDLAHIAALAQGGAG